MNVKVADFDGVNPTVVPARRRALLRDHDFRLLWIGETVSQAGSAMTVVALPLVAITVVGASPLVLGVLTACAWLPALLISLPAGAWVDQVGRRPVMQAANLASAVLFLSVPVAAWIGALTVAHLAVVAFGGGVARVFFRTAFQAYVPTVLPRGRLTAGNAWLSGSESASEVVGPGLAGVVAQALGAVSVLVVDGLSFVVSAACLWRIRATELAGRRRDNTGLFSRIRAGVRYVFDDRYLRTTALFASTGNLTQAAVQTLLLVFLLRTVGQPAGTAGLLLAAMGAGGLAGALLAAPLANRFGTARALLGVEAVTVPFGLLIPLTTAGPRLALFPIGLTVMFAGVTAGSIITRSFRQQYVPDDMLARTGATMTVLAFGAIPIGALAGGWLASTIGVRTALWLLCAALLLPVLVLVYSPIRHRRDLPVREAVR
ncbi:MFS transporter [Virgisporangium aurantiacum]|uniref:MFS transporter n=1 Tax=Virgisporangium aurantiacum TaxID=175570 RepID=A0A8J4E0X0_9ACTN|nr:MFS transporter [Virgisporangium aurantiacum]GIJ57163.1 MFS transporter [Virgisporangium aurantiacum]